jgi:hypothetical protein
VCGTGTIDSFDDEVADALHTIRRHEHSQGAHVLRAEALGRNPESQPIALDQFDVNRGRRRIAGHLEAARRIARDRPTQVTRARAFTNTRVHRLRQRAADEVNVLADVEHDDGHAAVLADRHAFRRRNFVVVHELFKSLTPERRRFGLDRAPQGIEDVLWNDVIRFDQQTSNSLPDRRDIDLPDQSLRGSGMRVRAFAGTCPRL